MSFNIHHDQAARRFETTIDGVHCLLDYTLADGVAIGVMTARKHGWKVMPACSYADVWMKRHVSYQDLRA